METYKKQKTIANDDCFCSATMLTPKIIENHSQFLECAHYCNIFVSSRSL